MYEWSEEDLMVRDAVRGFIDKEIRPHIDELETGVLPPYDIIRNLLKTFGVDAMASDAWRKSSPGMKRWPAEKPNPRPVREAARG